MALTRIAAGRDHRRGYVPGGDSIRCLYAPIYVWRHHIWSDVWNCDSYECKVDPSLPYLVPFGILGWIGLVVTWARWTFLDWLREAK